MHPKNNKPSFYIIFATTLLTVSLMTASAVFGLRLFQKINENRRVKQANSFLREAHDLQLLCFRHILPKEKKDPFIVICVRYISGDTCKDPPQPVVNQLSDYPYQIGLRSNFQRSVYGGMTPKTNPDTIHSNHEEGRLYFVHFIEVTPSGIVIEMGERRHMLDGSGWEILAAKNENGEWEIKKIMSHWLL